MGEAWWLPPDKGTMDVQKISTGYKPRDLQQKLHNSFKRFNVVVLHRRAGKTVMCINEMIDRALRNPLKNPVYAYLAPFYGQSKRNAWVYLKDYTKNITGYTANEAELRIDISRPSQGDHIRIQLLGAENPAALRGIYLDGCILDEYAEMQPEVWSQVIRPALSDRKGWAIFIGTPKGSNHFQDLFLKAKELPGWFSALHKASETGIIDPDELEAARAEMSEEEFNQEYECSFSSPKSGSYYGELMDNLDKAKRIRDVPYDPALPVDTYWDLGVGDTTVIWFLQRFGNEYRFIDHVEMSGKGLDYYAKIIKEKPYVYDRHTLPHDAAARSMETGNTRQETLRALGIKTLIQPRQNVDDGIQAVRKILPLSYFDKIKCERGIMALKNYCRKWDAKNQIFSDTPKHDWSSNSADAMRYCAIGQKSDKNDKTFLPRESNSSYNIFEEIK